METSGVAYGTANASTSQRLIDRTLPVEIWLDVFRLLSVSRGDLKSVVLTSHLFRLLAQSLLFTEFSATIQAQWLVAGRWQSREYLERLVERLALISSNHVANAVKSVRLRCDIIPVEPVANLVTGDEVVATLFETLPRLKNAVILQLEGAVLKPHHFNTLAQLPHLSQIVLSASELSPDNEESPDLRLTSITIRRPPNGVVYNENNPSWWIPLVRLDTTKILRIYPEAESLAVCNSLALNNQPFPALRSLCLHVQAAGTPNFVDLTRNASRVVELTLTHPLRLAGVSVSYADLPNDVLPSITSLTAPIEFLNKFTRSVQLRHVCLPFFYHDTLGVRGSVARLSSACPELQYFSVSVTFLYEAEATLRRIFSSFPNLVACRIEIEDSRDEDLYSTCNVLSTIDLPSTLQYLHIGGIVLPRAIHAIPPEQLSAIIDPIRYRSPQLKLLLMIAAPTWFLWRSSENPDLQDLPVFIPRWLKIDLV